MAQTMTQTVGRNVRRHRLDHSWTQQELAGEMERHGVSWSQSICAQAEGGKRPITVEELLALGLALGIAPHVLLYPTEDVQAGEATLDAYELLQWLWRPDDHSWSTAGIYEAQMAAEASEERVRFLTEEKRRLQLEAEASEERFRSLTEESRRRQLAAEEALEDDLRTSLAEPRPSVSFDAITKLSQEGATEKEEETR